MINVRYWYHRTMAGYLNWRAKHASRVLREVGARSNHHERQRDKYDILRGA